MERFWLIVAGCLAAVAATLLWLRRFDGAFVCGALGILAWFISMRSRLKREASMIENVAEPEAEDEWSAR